MDLVLPGIGLTFWMCLVFGTLLFLLKKFAWKPILTTLQERENSIAEALSSAEKAKQQMSQLQSENETLMKQARDERDLILKEARQMKDSIVSEAKTQAQEEANKIIEKAQNDISKQKNDAIAELKNQVAVLSVGIAEKLLNNQLQNNAEQQNIIADNIKKLNQSQNAIA